MGISCDIPKCFLNSLLIVFIKIKKDVRKLACYLPTSFAFCCAKLGQGERLLGHRSETFMVTLSTYGTQVALDNKTLSLHIPAKFKINFAVFSMTYGISWTCAFFLLYLNRTF